MDNHRAKILIAEDNASDRLLLATLLRRQGHTVVEAADGIEAVALFQRERPELVLLDVLMPRLDGLAAVRSIRELAADDFVPVVFLTSLQEPAELARCLEAGGDDFLSKPYNEVVLKAKIDAFCRMREMHRTVQHQRDEIARNNRYLVQEQEVAKRVFDKVAHAGSLTLPNIRYRLSPLAVFNGDVLLASTGPAGNLQVLLGDFTGHGLAAAIGAMPLAQTFYSMVAKGFHLRDILREINAKLHDILPVGVFCCATAADFDFSENLVQVWNGGLPDGYLYRSAAGEVERLPSRHLPLGIKPGRQFDDTVESLEVAPGDRLFLWSDGIIEATNHAGEMFGEARLADIFRAGFHPARLFDEVNGAVERFLGEDVPADDLSLVEVLVVDRDHFAGLAPAYQERAALGPMDWRMSFELYADSLRSLNPLPLLLHMLMEVPALRPRSGQLYTALAELFSNALEHGVLRLDSTLKDSPLGFASYYQERSLRLQELVRGHVKFALRYRGDDNGGSLTITVEDSGSGFDVASTLRRRAQRTAYAGRGVTLLEKIGHRLHFLPPGNVACLEYVWGQWQRDGREENGAPE